MTETADTPSGIRIERMLPLYEAKMMSSYDHRSADVVKSLAAGKRQNQPRYLDARDHANPQRLPQPISWIGQDQIAVRKRWLTGFSDVTSATNERTVLAGALPLAGVGHTYPLFFCADPSDLLAILNSLPLDFVARQKVAGLHLTYGYVKQFPVLRPKAFREPCNFDSRVSSGIWVRTRVLELTYTAWDMGDVDDSSRVKPPFVWDPERRFLLRAELDAAFFHLYGITRDDVDYILDTFPIVRRKDMDAHGEYRTKRVILEMYDAMHEAIDSGVPYKTPITPPPGEGPRHPQREESP